MMNETVAGSRPTSVIDAGRIEASGAQDLGDVVAHAPGVFVRRYGGLGGLRTVSLRGTSPQQVALFVDGVRYGSSSESGFDLGNIPAAALERVEVVRGGDAALFGANSLGGAVNVITGASVPGGMRIGATGAIGSFGERSLGMHGATRFGGHSVNLAVHGTESSGDYPFIYNEFGETVEAHRSNGDFDNLYGRAGWSWQPNGGWNFGASAQAYDTERGVPGAVVQGSREQLRARLQESDIFVTAHAERSIGRWVVSLSGNGRRNDLRYVDPDARLNGPDGIDNSYDRSEAGLTGKAIWFPDDNTLLSGTLEADAAYLSGDNLDPSVGSSVNRRRLGSGLRGTRRFAGGWFGTELKLDAGLRFDFFSDLNTQLAPSVGLVWRPFEEPLRFRAHLARNYRAPSFSEQYYLNFGNADLNVERSESISLGATWEATPRLVVEAGLFGIDTRDLIVSIPRSPVSWSARNVGHVVSRGLELGTVGSFLDGLLDAQLSYTLMEALDRSGGITEGHLLPYAPQELFNGILGLNRWGVTLSGSWEYVSHRHTLAYNTAEGALPHYLLINAGLAARHRFGRIELTGRLNVLNLFDEEYQVVRNYPMPGRSLRLECGVSWIGGEG